MGQRLPRRPIKGKWPYLWLDTTYLKVRDGRHCLGCGDNCHARLATRLLTEFDPD
jgi:hypothetical protein